MRKLLKFQCFKKNIEKSRKRMKDVGTRVALYRGIKENMVTKKVGGYAR